MPVNNLQETRNKAAELQTVLGCPNWLNFIGVGEDNGKPCIVLYSKRQLNRECFSQGVSNMPFP